MCNHCLPSITNHLAAALCDHGLKLPLRESRVKPWWKFVTINYHIMYVLGDLST